MGSTTTAETTYVLDQTTGLMEAINEHGETIIISGVHTLDDGSTCVEISGDIDESHQLTQQQMIGQEVEVVSVDQAKTPRRSAKGSRPSLLRRGPRTSTMPSHVTSYPPQISPSVLSRYGVKSASARASPSTSYLSAETSAPTRSLGSSLYDRKTIINADRSVSTSIGRHSIIAVGGNSASSSVEEIVIWQPREGMEDCEIVQVDEEHFQQLFQNQGQESQEQVEQEGDFKYEDEEQTHGFQLADGTIIDPVSGQQIIICGGDGENVELSDFMNNFVQFQTVSSVSNGKSRKTPKVSKRKLSTELKCQEEGCNAYVHNVIDLRKHLQNQHMIELDEENVFFANDEEFRTWRTNYERDRKVSFIYRGGTKKISPERAVTYLICHRSGVYKPTPGAATERKRKMKPQGSCKIGTHCTAGVKLLKNLTNGTIEATICHTHYGHELENIQHLRVNSAVKEILLGKFDEGMTFAQVIQYVHHNPDGLEGLRVVDRRAIRNIYDQWKKMNHVSSQSQQQHSSSSSTDGRQEEDTSVILHTAEITDIEPGGENEDNDDPHNQHHTTANNEEGGKQSSKDETSSQNTPELNATAASPQLTPAPSPSFPIKKSANRSLKEPGPMKSLNELIHEAIENLLGHGESGPTVLYYKKIGNRHPVYGGEDSSTSVISKQLGKDELCVILQTPVQRQLLQMFGKILYVDIVAASDLDLLIMAVLDEFMTAIPVAWMIVSEVNSTNVELCFHYVKQNCVEVKCEYFFSSKSVDHCTVWGKVFGKKPRLMLSQEDTIRDFTTLVKRQFDEEELRVPFIKQLETLVTTPNRQTYEDTLKSIKLKSTSLYKVLAKDWLLNKSQWAFHTRLRIPLAIEESFGRFKKFVLFKGTKKLSRNVGNVLKIGYDRCFQRNKSLFKGDLKFQQLLDSIQANHDTDLGKMVKIEQLSPIKFKVQDEFTVFDLQTECNCRIVCKSCGVCAHRYWCSCVDNQNFCSHAHHVCLFSKPNWPVKSDKVEEPPPTFVQLVEPQRHRRSGFEQNSENKEDGEENEPIQEEEADDTEDQPSEVYVLNTSETESCEPSASELTQSVERTNEAPVTVKSPTKTPTKTKHTTTEPIQAVRNQSLPSPTRTHRPELDQRRTSSRIKQKITRPLEDEFEATAHKRGRRDSSTATAAVTLSQESASSQSSTSSDQKTVSEEPPPSPSKRKPGRPPTRKSGSASESQSQASQCSQDEVKDDIQNLLTRISNINDEKLLADIKKKVGDIAGLLGSMS